MQDAEDITSMDYMKQTKYNRIGNLTNCNYIISLGLAVVLFHPYK